jgi:hypothetical protein
VQLASAALKHDFWSEGRTLDRLGFDSCARAEDILEFVNSGPRFWEG